MRIALLMCGQPRTLEFCFPSLKKHVLDVYHPDVFVCSDEQEARLIELFRPVKIDVKPQEYIDTEIANMRLRYHSPEDETMVHKDLSIAWKVWRAAQLKREFEAEEGFTYDVVLISRFDVKFAGVQPIENVEEKTIYVPRIGAYHITPPDAPGIHWKGYSAHLCWMNSNVADMMSSFYFEGEDTFKLACEVDPTWGRNPEHVFKFFCDRNGIRAQLVEISMMLIRGTADAPLSFHHQSLEKYPQYK